MINEIEITISNHKRKSFFFKIECENLQNWFNENCFYRFFFF